MNRSEGFVKWKQLHHQTLAPAQSQEVCARPRGDMLPLTPEWKYGFEKRNKYEF